MKNAYLGAGAGTVISGKYDITGFMLW